ncbi:MAG: DUF1513 domain-containing protein [Marinobacterium sp.]|nr:DUF1513 domain-containing protein [Marinobacterium sp.]
MVINRRNFLAALGAGLLLPVTGAAATAETPLRFASASQDAQGSHWLVLFDDQGNERLRHQLPGRAHHVAAHPTQPWLMAVARRPDRFIDVVSLENGALLKRIDSGTERHFYGHAIFSADGRWLVATENHIPTSEGRVVIRDCHNGFTVVADHPSYGIGPHELAWLNDQRTLVVANGGIQTHPDKGREMLNLDSMQPSLVRIDSRSGTLLEKAELPAELHQCSIRHIDINPHDQVAIAMQYQGELYDNVPLTALYQPGLGIRALELPEPIRQKMKQYCGSARFDHSGDYFAISAPRGDLISFWQRDGRFLDSIRVRDGCGLAATDQPGAFVISSGNGRCYHYNLHTRRKTKLPLAGERPQAWDNHMVRVS